MGDQDSGAPRPGRREVSQRARVWSRTFIMFLSISLGIGFPMERKQRETYYQICTLKQIRQFFFSDYLFTNDIMSDS